MASGTSIACERPEIGDTDWQRLRCFWGYIDRPMSTPDYESKYGGAGDNSDTASPFSEEAR